MKTTKTKTGFIQHYDDELIKQVECNIGTGRCLVHLHDGRVTSVQAHCSIYTTQYGISVSGKHACIFVSSWEDGMGCFSAITGEELWRLKGTRYTKVFVYPEYVVVVKFTTALIKLDISNGKEIDRFKGRGIETVFELSKPLLFAGLIRGVYCTVDTTNFEIIKKFDRKIINPNDCLSLVIRSLEVDDENLVISGFEGYAHGQYPDGEEAVDFERAIGSAV